MGNCLNVARQQFFFGIADNLAERVIDFKPATFLRYQGHADGRKIESAAEAFFAFLQYFSVSFGLLGLGNRDLDVF